MTSDDSNLESQQPAPDPSAGDPNPPEYPLMPDGSFIDDVSPTRTYEGSIPHIQDPTVISDGPPVSPSEVIAGTPLQLRDIGKALMGQQLGHFQLGEFVGGGGMGAVFRGTDTQLNRTVAVKVLTQRYGGREDTVRRFRVEAQSAARLNHENIATVYFVGEDKGWNFIVFEFIEGENVRDLVVRDGPMDIAAALSCAAQVAAALQHAAERQVVHRDIKPSNVLLAPDGKAKLVDMGLARLRQVETHDDDLTVSGVTLGTFDYISPEQGRDPRNADVRSDLYSLGCTLYYMLTGSPPYPDRTVLQKLLSHTSDPAPDPRALRPDVPDDVAELTLRLLEKLPKNRYQDPAVLIRDIVGVAESNGIAIGVKRPKVKPPVVVEPTAFQRSLPWLLPTIVLLVSVFALDSFLSHSGGATSSLPEFEINGNPPVIDGSVREASPDDDGSGLIAADGAGIENVTWPPDAVSADEGIGEPDLDRLINTELSPSTLFPESGMGVSGPDFSGRSEYTFDENNLLGGSAAIFGGTDSEASGIGRDRVRLVDASVDIVVAEATQVETLENALGSEGYRVVTTLPEALAIASRDPGFKQIELRTNFARIDDPVRIATQRLTISAAEGFEPVLRFAPGGDGLASNEKDFLGMIEIETGNVSFESIHFDFDTRSLDAACSLFVVQNAEGLSIKDGWIRIMGDSSEVPAYERALFAVASSGGRLDAVPPTPVIRCTNVVFAGESSVLTAPESRPLRIEWNNGFIGISRTFAVLGGVVDETTDQIKIDLDHVTAVMDKGLCRCVASKMLPQLLTVGLNVTRSILVTPESEPLLVSAGYVQDVDDLEAQMLYGGDRNFYEGTRVFWERVQQPRTGFSLSMPIRMEFDEWRRDRRSYQEYQDKVIWQNAADPSLPRRDMKPEDYFLRDVPNNLARRAGGGVERSDAGFQSAKLPMMPGASR